MLINNSSFEKKKKEESEREDVEDSHRESNLICSILICNLRNTLDKLSKIRVLMLKYVYILLNSSFF